MDPIKEIEELKADRKELQRILLTTTDRSERLAILQGIKTNNELIAVLLRRLPPEPDNRPIWHRYFDSIQLDSIAVRVSAFTSLLTTMWIVGFYCTPISHKYRPYTEGQMGRRERLIHPKIFRGCSVPPLPILLLVYSSLLVTARSLSKQALEKQPNPSE
jgi:hypothetical protein